MATASSMCPHADTCPACGSQVLDNRGPLPRLSPHIFGGERVDTVLQSGYLLHCINCDLRFRSPYINQSILTKLYEKLPPTVWECTEPRAYWSQILQLMARYSPNEKVLDVGCFRGDFLAWLPRHWYKMGIEPNAAASQMARDRGLRVIGTAIEEIRSTSESAGVITLIDVMEHLVDPFTALKYLRKNLASSGSIIILTGAADTLPWRIFGRDYWYSALPEHVSFFTHKWFRWAGERLGLSTTWFRYISSEPGPLTISIRNFLRQSGYAVVGHLRRLSIPESVIVRLPTIKRAAKWSSPPWWREARDHILIVLTKQ